MWEHLDAIVTGIVALIGWAIVHARSVGKFQQALLSIEEDLREIKAGVRRTNRRFHHSNNFAMELYASIRMLGEKAGVAIPALKAYNFVSEADDESAGGT